MMFVLMMLIGWLGVFLLLIVIWSLVIGVVFVLVVRMCVVVVVWVGLCDGSLV